MLVRFVGGRRVSFARRHRQAIKALYGETSYQEDEGIWTTELNDGGVVRVFADENAPIAEAFVHIFLTPDACDILWELARDSEAVLLPITSPPRALVTTDPDAVQLPPNAPPPVVCRNVADLHAALLALPDDEKLPDGVDTERWLVEVAGTAPADEW